MALRNWGIGKLIILWVWGALISIVAYTNYPHVPPDRPAVGYLLLLAIVAPPMLLSIVSWRWLSARERK